MKNQNSTITKPPRLVPGDTIGIVAPAGPYDPELFRKGVAALEAMEFGVFQPPGLSKRERFLAGPDAHRAGLINQMFADPDIKGIFCARGGYGSLRILDLIAYDTIQQNPKVFIGFSDISALISAIGGRSGLVMFHGPVLTTLGNGNAKTAASLKAALTFSNPIRIQVSNGEVVRAGTCSGIVTGGNLNTLCHLVGTPFEPVFSDRIVILEDTGEAPYKIDRMLSHMRLANCFEGMAGLVLGTFSDCGEPGDFLEIVKDIFDDTDIPVLAGFDIGHGPVNLTIPMGIQATLDTERLTLSYDESAVI
ncbi:MAG: LD-carboxypeptidase [Deltaproteobacteria bacterium]|nr:LD-carboxypeptidase [Deltaproteobacteria bacterium]